MSDLTSTSATEAPPSAETADLLAMMLNLGPQLEAEEMREYSQQEWAVGFNDDLIVHLEHDAEKRKLYLSAELGAVPEGQEVEMQTALLQFTGQWQETGGYSVGLAPDDEQVMLIHGIPVAGLNLDALVAQVREFSDSARALRALLAESGSEGAAPADLDTLLNAVRV